MAAQQPGADGDWILALGAPQLHRIVDLMGEPQATEARQHPCVGVPLVTGPGVQLSQLIARLP